MNMSTAAYGSPLVLVVDDSPEVIVMSSTPLLQHRYRVVSAQTGEDALGAIRDLNPDVILLDLGLPDMDGLELCRYVREASDAFIVIVSGRTSEEDRLAGFEAGADDYLTKPFSPLELVLRVGSMLRRGRAYGDGAAVAPMGTLAAAFAPAQLATVEARIDDVVDVDVEAEGTIQVGDLVMDTLAREVRVEGRAIELTRIEFELLQLLLERRNIVLSRDQIMDAVWGPNWFGDSHVIETHISKLRKKLGDSSRMQRYVRVIRGVGYRLGPCADTQKSVASAVPQLAIS